MNRKHVKFSPLPSACLREAASAEAGERVRVRGARRNLYLSLVLIFGLLGTGCAVTKEETHAHGETASVKTYPKEYIHPLTEINFEKVVNENRGLKVLEENATTVHDYYRGAVQEKAEGERLMKESKWEEARSHLEKSNWFLRVVLKYLPEDEAYRNIFGDHVIIFLPNLLSADNYLKLVTLYKKMGRDDKALETKGHGEYYLSQSLKSVKTEWGLNIQKEFEGLPGK
jgi:hypothetical protein